MKISSYEIKLRLVGEAMIIPDSQRIFGWLAQRITEDFSSEASSEFVSNIQKEGFMISSLLPEGYYPMPKTYYLSRIVKILESKRKLNELKDYYQAIKQIDYLNKDELYCWEKLGDNDFYKNKLDKLVRLDEINEKDKIHKLDMLKIERHFSQKCKVSDDFYRVTGLNNELYSIPLIRLRNITKGKRIYQKDFSIFVATGNEILKEWLEFYSDQEDIITIGPRSSQGLNMYMLKKIEPKGYIDLDLSKEKLYLNLGVMLPGENLNFTDSFLTLRTSSRKPVIYGEYRDKKTTNKNSQSLENRVGDEISFIDGGSVLSLNENGSAMNVGKSIRNSFNKQYKNAIVFGNSYLVVLKGKRNERK